MFTICPECKIVFEISAQQPGSANTLVHCGNCQQHFNATGAVFDTLDDANKQLGLLCAADDIVNRVVENALTAIDFSGAKINADSDFYANPPAGEQVRNASSRDEYFWSMEDDLKQKQFFNKAILFRIFAISFIVLFLFSAYVWTQSTRLSTNPALRLWLEPFCRVARCDIPVRQDLFLYEIVTLQVTDNPRVKGTLLLTLVFKNKADFVQPYPVLRVAFSDKSGDEISVRTFRPHEYLSSNSGRLSGLKPGARKRLLFELPDPGKKAFSYQLDFVKAGR